jgi:hypothetical protein
MLYPPLAVFEDALPDDWGRRLLAAAITADDGGTPTLPEMLLRMRGGGTGALLFTATDTAPQPDQSVPSIALSKLLAAAARFVHSYSDLAQVLRKHSASPADDLAALYRHMIFNAAIGNVDDHLKNFWMLARPGGFRLAPAFDLVPDISGRGEHTLSFQQGFACPAGAEMIELAAEWGVARAARIVEDVVKATKAFATTARRLKVRHPGSLQKVCADVRRRTGLLTR